MSSRTRRRNNGLEILSASHVDHGLTKAHLDYILERYADRNQFFIETITLPAGMPSLQDALYGPANGDAPVNEVDVHYARRGSRPGDSRMINAPLRETRKLTVIAGPHEGRACVLYTAFGGVLTPKEPSDPTLNPAQREESAEFWAQHALATGKSAPRANKAPRRNIVGWGFIGSRFLDKPYSQGELAKLSDENLHNILRALADEEWEIGHPARWGCGDTDGYGALTDEESEIGHPAWYHEAAVREKADSMHIEQRRREIQAELDRRSRSRQGGLKGSVSRRRKNSNAADGPTYEDDPHSGDEYIYNIIRAGGEHAVEVYKQLIKVQESSAKSAYADAAGNPGRHHDRDVENARERLGALGHPRLTTFGGFGYTRQGGQDY